MTANPLRRHAKGASQRARRGVVANPSSSSRPTRPAVKTSTGRGVPGSGSTSARVCSTSSQVPTGSSVARACPSVEAERPYPATFTVTRYQPLGRHSGGCTMLSAWTRPGGTVCDLVSSRP